MRPALLVGVLAVAGVLVFVAVLLGGRKSSPSAAGNVSNVILAATDTTSSAAEAITAVVGTGTNISSNHQVANAGGAVTGATNQTGMDAATLKELIRKLKDPSLSAEERKQVIQALAENGSPEALAALKDALASGSEELRVAVAEGLGACGSQECTTMLQGLLHDASEAVIKAAVRGLAAQGTPQSATALTQVLYDTQQSDDVRVAAATGLGSIDQPGVMDTLSQAALGITDENLVTQILAAIGTRDISETQSFYENYLRSPNISSDLKVEAAESLWQAKGDPSTFLATLAGNPDADIRTAAAWALSATSETGKLGPQLTGMLQAESDSDVRLRLYQALGNQESFDMSAVQAALQKETESSAQAAGLNLIAKTLQSNPTPELQAYFDQTALPALKNIALTGEFPHDRMVAIMALARTDTPGAGNVLQEISQQSKDSKVAAAAAQAAANRPPKP